MGSLYRERCAKRIDHLSQYFRLMGTIGAGVLVVWLGWPGQRAFDLLHPNQAGIAALYELPGSCGEDGPRLKHGGRRRSFEINAD
jgi:hypothetical protein